MSFKKSDLNRAVVYLSRDEALVLSHLLFKWEDSGSPRSLVIDDDAEQWALLSVASELQGLSEVFGPGFEDRLAQAKARVVARFNGDGGEQGP